MFATAGEAVKWVGDVTTLYVACDRKRRLAVDAWPEWRAATQKTGKD